ncbi:MAG: citrate lyase subunit alpha, partial [Candidatus Izemoplasma sp.]
FRSKNISFHHHLRNGDFVINLVLENYLENNVKKINLFPSAIFPSYLSILDLIKNNQINNITTNYMNGPVAKYISKNGLPGKLLMQTHGGRARSIVEGKTLIDIAYIAAPYVDHHGNAVGHLGKNACGSLGYVIADSIHAKIKVIITDTLVEDTISEPEILGEHIDYIVVVDSIGDSTGIVSGTTSVTTDPIGIKIAKYTSEIIDELGYLKTGFSYQSGAGGVSLRTTFDIGEIMKKHKIKASFFSGGITQFHVDMLEEGLVDKLYDVQCFDLEAVKSLKRNKNHIAISASKYANPSNSERVIKDLDIVILGATEIDYDFNVNVTTSSHQIIIGGSGGHSDTATDAKLSIIVSSLIKARIPVIKQHVTTITTLGKNIDVLVTERGIAINPLRVDLINKLKNSKLNIMTIKELSDIAHSYTNIPKEIKQESEVIGYVEDRTYEIIDKIYKV